MNICLNPKTPEPATERALFIVAQHLQRAQRSHTQAMQLQAQGQAEAARTQSRMTRVFLHNALHHIEPASRTQHLDGPVKPDHDSGICNPGWSAQAGP